MKLTNDKSQAANSKQGYDLEDRTLEFAKNCRKFVKQLPKTVINKEDGKQLVRSSGSVGANYIEANEALSHKDFVHRLKISRKEARESKYWLTLIESKKLSDLREELLQEAIELIKILSSIIQKVGKDD